MNKNTERIKAGLKKLTHHANELISGTVVSGSLNMNDYTCSVQIAGDNVITSVLLSAVTENGNGVILVPADGSNVVIGSIDGPGVYFLVRASDLVKVITTINETVLTIDENGYSITRAGKSLKDIVTNLIDAIKAITVPTSNGPSGQPINASSFEQVQNDINDLLT